MLCKLKTWLTFSRIGGVGAIGFATMIVLANAIAVPAGQPTPGAAMSEVSAYFAANAGVVGGTAMLIPAAWLLATIFGASVVAITWRTERRRGDAWALVGFAGILLQNGTFAAVIACRLAMVAAPDSLVLWSLHDALFGLNGTFLATALIGLTMSGRRSDLIPVWLAAVGLVAAAFLLASASLSHFVMQSGGAFGPLGLIGWLGWVVWLLSYGVSLIRHQPDSGCATATPDQRHTVDSLEVCRARSR